MITCHTLPNGLRIVIDPINTVETVSMGMWIRIGTRNETADINGVSHFLEHMAFKGTRTRTALEIVEAIENVGGYINAYTSREMTTYQARVLKGDLPLALEIIADILLEPAFLEEEFERERGVITQELLESLDTPDDIVFDHFQRTLFPDQPLGRPILGTLESLNSFTVSTVRDYMKASYAPHKMVLAVAGNVDPEAVIQQVTQAFGGLTDFTPPALVSGHYKGGTVGHVKDLEQTQWTLGFPGIQQGDPEFYTSAVLSTLLGGGMSSRLFQEVREKHGLAYTIYAYHSCYQDTGIFGVYASTQPDHTLKLTKAVKDLLVQLPDSLTPQEIDRAKAQMKAGTLMGLESTNNRAERCAQQLHILGRIMDNQETIERIDGVSLTDLQSYATKIFSGTPTCVTLGPTDQSGQIQEILG